MISLTKYLNDEVKKVEFNKKEFEVNDDFRVGIEIQEIQKELKKKQLEDPSFNADLDMIFIFFEKILGKEFVKELNSVKISQNALMSMMDEVLAVVNGVSLEEWKNDKKK